MLPRILYAIALLMFVGGCSDKRSASADPMVANLMAATPGLTRRCAEKADGNPRLLAIEEIPDCYEMTPPRRWSGLLNLGFEWSNFCPSPAQTCSLSSDRGDVWTELGTGVFKGDELPDGLYQVEFVGRRTLKAGHFGHLNQYDHYMMVDRIVSVKRVGEGGYQ